jgi:hypothetical protein
VKRQDPRSDPRSKTAAIQCAKGVTGHYPKFIVYDTIIKALGDRPDGKKASDCYKEWVLRGHNPVGWGWLDWYRDGIPSRSNGHGPPRASPLRDAKTIDWTKESLKYPSPVSEEDA